MGKNLRQACGFFRRLSSNESGNVLIIVAAAVIPLIAMIGGGIDLSRLYLAKTRLQQACDAGALAGRKAMNGLTFSADNKKLASKFFTLNFPDGRYGSKSVSVTYDASSAGAVTGNATALVPMSLMAIFKEGEKQVFATCTADLQLPNTDVMFVLDTTLSMSDTNPQDSQSKISVLRNSVRDFYTQLQAVKPAGSKIRYGFVPYSSTVNVGMLLKRDWIQDNPIYDSRIPDGTAEVISGPAAGTVTTTTTEVLSGTYLPGPQYNGSAEKCVAPASTVTTQYSAWSAWSPSATALPRSQWRTYVQNGTSYSAKLSNGVCTITSMIYDNYTVKQTQTVDENKNAGNTTTTTVYHWIYKPISYPMTALKGSGSGDTKPTGGKFDATVANNHTNRSISWGITSGAQTPACIEERSTRRTSEGNSTPRYDMDVDLVPDRNNPATQWKPYLPGIVYGRGSTSFTATTGWIFTDSAPTETRTVSPKSTLNYVTPSSDINQYGACPTYSRKLDEITLATLNSYLAALTPAGFTYHDIGFVWGLRLMSPDGLFAAENKAAETTGKVARHLIFMTDGDTDTRVGAYDAWGMSGVTRRRTPTASIPTDAAQNSITEARLRELCTLAKNEKNITVWVIAFGTTLTPLLSDCGSPGRSYQANNASELTATFTQIASQIAQLRITR